MIRVMREETFNCEIAMQFYHGPSGGNRIRTINLNLIVILPVHGERNREREQVNLKLPEDVI